MADGICGVRHDLPTGVAVCDRGPGHDGNHCDTLTGDWWPPADRAATGLTLLNGDTPRPLGPKGDYITRAQLDNDLTELSLAILHQVRQVATVVKGHQAVLQELERRSFHGRIRRARDRARELIERVRSLGL